MLYDQLVATPLRPHDMLNATQPKDTKDSIDI